MCCWCSWPAKLSVNIVHTGHRMFQFLNDTDCERIMGAVCPQTQTRFQRCSLAVYVALFGKCWRIMLWAKPILTKQHGGPRDNDEVLFQKRRCANQGHCCFARSGRAQWAKKETSKIRVQLNWWTWLKLHGVIVCFCPWFHGFLNGLPILLFFFLLFCFFFNQWIHGYYASNSAPKQCCAVEEFDEVQLSRIHIFSLYFGCMENEECGVWSVEMSIVHIKDCGKRKVWTMGVWKKRNMKKRGKKPKHKSRKDLISEVSSEQ